MSNKKRLHVGLAPGLAQYFDEQKKRLRVVKDSEALRAILKEHRDIKGHK